ncbi:MAG: DNA primase catalytic subunit PriS [Candidatus Micrarchaeota archaeon]
MKEEFCRKMFARYYQQAQFDILRIDQREFGIGNIKKIDARHLAFPTTDAFRTFLVSNTPRFVSHSAAYYRFPAATPIEKKGRLGADLIFDLDMHAEGKYAVYSRLPEMKEELTQLVEEFLLKDFGLKKEELLIAFSGNRGYHVHVHNDDFAILDGDERKEITNYVRGEGLRINQFFSWEQVGKQQKLIGPKPTDGGYRGRLARLAITVLQNEPTAISRIFAKEEKRNFFISGINEGNWSRTTMKLESLPERFSKLQSRLAVQTINADPAVTYDMSKLIRVPNTIHGDTGFVAKIVTDLNSFDPLKHAVINGPAVAIRFTEEVPQLSLLNETFGPFAVAQKAELPLGVAMFFMLKGSAELS